MVFHHKTIPALTALLLAAPWADARGGDSKPVEVKCADELVTAFAEAKNHRGDPLEIHIADGKYEFDQPLALVGARNVKILADSGATLTSREPGSPLLLLAYCEGIRISRLQFVCPPRDKETLPNVADLLDIHQCRNVRLDDCTFEFAVPGEVPREKPKSTPAVREFLGEEILSILSQPDKVVPYRLIPKKASGGERLGDYPIDATGPELNRKQIAILTGVLLDENTYNFESAKRGFHLPEIGFAISKGGKRVSLLVDLYRNELVFLWNGEEKTEDCDSAKAVLETLIATVFPSEPRKEMEKKTPREATR